MKIVWKLWLLATVLAAVFLTGCTGEVPESTAGQTVPKIDPRTAYSAAKEAVDTAENLVLDYTLRETRKIGENTFTETVMGKASFNGYALGDMTAVVEETLDFGFYQCSYAETYCEGKAYALVNDCRFWTNLTPEAFADRQIPPVLLTPELYGSVIYGETRILFSQPKGLETWVGKGQLLEATGTAVLDGAGKLLQTGYQARYRTGAVEYTLEITVRVTVPEQLDLSGVHMAHGQSKVWLASLDAPRYLVQVVADVYAAQHVTCEMVENITSEAIPLIYSRSSRVVMNGRKDSLQAEVLNDARTSNNRGTVTQNSQTEVFRDGEYTLCINGSDPVRNGSVTPEAVRQYCEDTILSGLLAVKYLKGASGQQDGKLLRLELSGNESYRKALAQQLMAVLQVDLDAKAQSTRTLQSGGYLTVDLETRLPVSMGIYLEKSHTLDDVVYRLDYRLEESLSFTEE